MMKRRDGEAAAALAGGLAAGLAAWAWPAAAPVLAALAMAAACRLLLARLERPVSPPDEPADDPVVEPGLAAVAATIDDPLLFVERHRVTHANAAAIALLGDHIVGEDMRLAIRHPGVAARLSAPVDPADPPLELTGLGGTDRHWHLVAHPLGAGGLLVRLVDRTASRAAERMRVDFVANASHELRTPLATLLGYIETLEEANGPKDTATRLRFLKTMMGEARRMQRLIEDLMSLSRIEAERHSLPGAIVRLDDVAREVADAITSAQSLSRDRIAIVAGDALPPVAGDPAQLSQLLHNLIGNGLKYGRAGGGVSVSLESEGASVRLAVADEGEGIAREHLPRLTERFYRVDAGRSRAIGGTGLGLAIVKHIVERHRGRLDIASVVGRGTTVTVRLPAVEDAPEAVSRKSHQTITKSASNPPIAASGATAASRVGGFE